MHSFMSVSTFIEALVFRVWLSLLVQKFLKLQQEELFLRNMHFTVWMVFFLVEICFLPQGGLFCTDLI